MLSSMDMPTMDVDLGPERIPEEKVVVGGRLVYCDLCDTEVVHKLAQMLLPGLATACVDNTSGDLFKNPGSVAVDLRKEMIDYVTQRTESFVAESVILEGGPDGKEPDHPFDIISNFVDDFASSKSNLFTKVSGWLLSDKREDKIDDFIQEMEMTNFWTLDRRDKVAETFLKNVDFENKFHCGMKFNSADELINHVYHCNFRTMICENEGCNARFTAGHLEKHDSTCPFKIVQCEQKCSDSIMRRHMDRHCITVCPMKLINCPFYSVGCRSAIAQCLLEKHRSDDIGSHLWHLLKGKYKETSGEDLQRRVEKILQASSVSRLAEARDVRSLNLIVKDIEAKLGPLEVTVKKDSAETVAKNGGEGSNNIKDSELSTETIAKKDDGDDSDNKKKGSEPSTKAPDMVNSSYKAEVSDIVNMDSSRDIVMPDMVNSLDKAETSDVANMYSSRNVVTPDMVNSLDKAEASDVVDMDNSKNIVTPDMVNSLDKSEASDVVNMDNSKNIVTPDMVNSLDKAEASNVVNMDSSKNIAMPDMVNSLDKVEAGNVVNMDSSKNIAMPDMVNSLDKVEASNIVNMDSSENSAKNKDGKHSHIESSENSPKNKDGKHSHSKSSSENSPKNKDGEHSHIESRGSEERTHIPNMDSLPNEPEVSIVNKDNAQIYSKSTNGATGAFKIEGDDDNTQTITGILSDKGEINGTDEDGAKRKSKKKHSKDSSSSGSSSDSSAEDDKDNEKRKQKQKQKMKNKGNAKDNDSNKDSEDDIFEDSLQEDFEG